MVAGTLVEQVHSRVLICRCLYCVCCAAVQLKEELLQQVVAARLEVRIAKRKSRMLLEELYRVVAEEPDDIKPKPKQKRVSYAEQPSVKQEQQQQSQPGEREEGDERQRQEEEEQPQMEGQAASTTRPEQAAVKEESS